MEPIGAAGEVVEVTTDPAYAVHIGPGVTSRLDAACRDASRVALLVDARVDALHGERLDALGDAPKLALEGCEDTKSFTVLERVLDFFVQAGLDRSSYVVTFGGGTLGDLGGLAASLFKRGVAVVHVPTTLLAQVDASVGGKTAVNLAAGKNLAGTFHQPRAVLADTALLATLSEDELRSGLGEVVKTAMLDGEGALDRLEACAAALAAKDTDALTETVARCVRQKARVVAQDPHERGARRALNLGHTFGHAIESVAGYGRVPHGVAVAAGLALALRASTALSLATSSSYAPRVEALLAALGLPDSLDTLRAQSGLALPADELVAAMAHDKKGAVGEPELVLPTAPGRVELGVRADAASLAQWLR